MPEKFKLTILFIFFVICNLSAQNGIYNSVNPIPSKPEEEKKAAKPRIDSELKNTISGTLGFFDPWIGVSYERVLYSRWGIDASIGLIGGSIGTKIYFPKLSNGKVSFLIGFSEGMLILIGPKHYIPAGMTFLGKNGFRFSLDFGPQIYHDPKEEIQFGMSMKLGKSF